MNIALVGFDTEGRATYDFLNARGDTITICDQNPDIQIPEGASSVLGDDYLHDLDRFDLIIRTAGMPAQRILEKNPTVGPKISSHINLFFEASPTRNIIGVTGTKGKGTTSTLITKMLEAAGKTVRLGGNIGVPPLTFLDELNADSWVVLELSSFQLSDIRHSPHIGLCLMVVPEHLNWHEDMADYTHAKSNMFAAQCSDDIAIYFADNDISRSIAATGAAVKVPYYASPGAFVNGNMITIDGKELCTTDEIQLLGSHNWQNVCAAVTVVWQAGVRDFAAIRSAIANFSGLPHRLELVRELDGIRYYNDSFAATPDAAIAAVAAIPGSKVVIVGGFDRELPLEHFAEQIQAHTATITKLLLIGQSASRVAASLEQAGFTNFVISSDVTMPAIVDRARALAGPGEAIVLSPGFASFDMFKNFADRGDQFRSVVEAL